MSRYQESPWKIDFSIITNLSTKHEGVYNFEEVIRENVFSYIIPKDFMNNCPYCSKTLRVHKHLSLKDCVLCGRYYYYVNTMMYSFRLPNYLMINGSPSHSTTWISNNIEHVNVASIGIYIPPPLVESPEEFMKIYNKVLKMSNFK